MAVESSSTATPQASNGRRHRVLSLVAGSILCLFAVSFLGTGGWALWVDRMDRDASGFVSIGTTDLRTPASALVGDLRGDGPRWVYGSRIWGTARVRATSQNGGALFMGIARTRDVTRYLGGAGYGTIEHLATNDVTTHPGGAVSAPPSQAGVWAASTQGTGRQTLLWKPRAGDWQIVVMNADASAGVAVQGGLSAKFPPAPWVAGGLLIVGAALAVGGGWLLVRGIRGQPGAPRPPEDAAQPSTPARVPVGTWN